MSLLVDRFGRAITYLRVSLTDKCNLRCIYCMPPEGVRRVSHDDVLRLEELERIISAGVEMGIEKVRLTGGEPLLKRGLLGLIERLKEIKGLNRITITTNGILLEEFAQKLFDAGVSGINVSLDTLKPEKFKKITGADGFNSVWRGIKRALNSGFSEIKINIVLLKGMNDDEIFDFVELARENPFDIRFIEFMPVSEYARRTGGFISLLEVMNSIEEKYCLISGRNHSSPGPAKSYGINGFRGKVSFIPAISQPFCEGCNRLRLTFLGTLKSCLFSTQEVDVKTMLRNGDNYTDSSIKELFLRAVEMKPQGHPLSDRYSLNKTTFPGQEMWQIGG